MRNLRLFPLITFLVLTLSASAQWRTASDISEGVRGSMTGTVADVDEARNRFLLDPDDDHTTRVTVTADSVTTQFNGFGGVINGPANVGLSKT